MSPSISFGTWLRQKRRSLDLTQKAFADQIGCAEITVRRMEADEYKPSKELALLLFEKLGIPESERPQWISFARGTSDLPSQSVPLPKKPNSNLPVSLSSFIGREKEQADAIKLISKHRLVTLTGSGGIGKTRLSLKVGEQVLGNYADGIWFVELAAILDSLLVPRTTAIAIGLRDEPQRPVVDMLSDYLLEKQMLMILDNCEHLLEACAQLADTLLKRCTGLKILATSREPLGITGEAIYRVPALELPNAQSVLNTFREFESVKLFEERAQLALFDFSLTFQNASAVAQICQRLDGIPLAIELAAAKVGVFSIQQIAEQLDENFNLLTGGSRPALPRHHTLRAAIDWSYNLLSATEQLVFQRLSLFIDGWTLQAAESVCGGGLVKNEDVPYVLEQLIHKSLVINGEDHGVSRYHMLETLRQYANEKLVESGENDTMSDKHLNYYLKLAETAEPHLIRPEQLKWLPLLDADYENLRSALEWALRKETAEFSLRLCAALGRFWAMRCYWLEGSKWLASAFAKPRQEQDDAEKAMHVRALCQDAQLADSLDELDRMKTSAELGLKLALEGSDRHSTAIAKYYVGFALFRVGDINNARAYLEQCLLEFQELNDPYWEANTYNWLGKIQFYQGERRPIETAMQRLALARKAGERFTLMRVLVAYSHYLYECERIDEARKYLEEAREIAEQLSSNTYSFILGPAEIDRILAQIEWLEGNLPRARALYMKAQASFHLLGERYNDSTCLESLGLLLIEVGELNLAQAHLEEAFLIARELEDKFLIAKRLAFLSILSYLQENFGETRRYFRESISFAKNLSLYHKAYFLESLLISPYFQAPENSVLILGAIDSFQKAFDFPIRPLLKRYCIRAETQARELLGELAYESTFVEGAKMSLDQTLELVLKTAEQM